MNKQVEYVIQQRRARLAQPKFARQERERQEEWQTQPDSPAYIARQALDDLFLQALGLPRLLKRGWGLDYAKPIAGGDPIAIQEYAKLVCEHVEKLNSLVESHKKHLLLVSRKRFTWPILKSKNPRLSQDEKKILRELEVTDETGRYCDQNSKWKPSGPTAYLVDELLSWVDACKKSGNDLYVIGGRFMRLSAVECLYTYDGRSRIGRRHHYHASHPVIAALRPHLKPRERIAAKLPWPS